MMIHSFEEAMAYLYHRLPMFQRIGAAAYKKDLSNTIKLAEALGNPHENLKCIHIGGTNGKGSTSSMLAAILQQAGYKVGLYTSPHLRSWTERIKINGENIAEQYVIDFLNQHQALIEGTNPSFFEVNTIMAFDYFAREKVDIAVIEVGLGGRLDCTNIIMPELSVITNIAYDHTEFLGDTLAQIAVEKAGIIKQNTPIVIGEWHEETKQVFENKANTQNAQIYFSSEHFQATIETQTLFFQEIRVTNKDGYEKLWKLDLIGKYQQHNLLTVLQSVAVLRDLGWQLPENEVETALSQVQKLTHFKGRMYVLQTQPLVICDTAHNEAGIAEVMPQITTFAQGKLHIVWGMVKDKNHEKVLKYLPPNAQYYFVCPNIPRGLAATEMQAIAAKFDLQGEVYESVQLGLDAAKQNVKQENEVVFVGGSTFVVAEVV